MEVSRIHPPQVLCRATGRPEQLLGTLGDMLEIYAKR
jgi:hypothetical protein